MPKLTCDCGTARFFTEGHLFAAAVQEELNRKSRTLLLELRATVVVFVCYLLSAIAMVYGVTVFKRAASASHVIFALFCWLSAVVALCSGCSIQILLAICRSV